MSSYCSSKYCSSKLFPHLDFHLLKKSLSDIMFKKTGLNILKHRDFKELDYDECLDFTKALEAGYNGESKLDIDLIRICCEEDPSRYEKSPFYSIVYVIDILTNFFCSHQILHLLNPTFPDCKFGKRCKDKHADDFILSSIIGYFTYDFNGNEKIFGSLHCFYNHILERHVFCINILDDYYSKFDDESILKCFLKQFNHDVLPSLFPMMSVLDSKYNDYTASDTVMLVSVDDPDDIIAELIEVMYNNRYDEIEDDDTINSDEYDIEKKEDF